VSTMLQDDPGDVLGRVDLVTVIEQDGEKMETGTIDPNLSSILREHRVFPPPPEFAAKAHVKSLEEYETLYRRSIQDPEGFWAEVARELHWFTPWTSVLDWQLVLQLRRSSCLKRPEGQDRYFVGG
jgi:hypothetical protein